MSHGPLPAYETPFVGRVTEFAQLTRQLTKARLVTVTGPGGVGKTRLALRAAARASAGFGDGTCLVRLSAVTDGALVPQEVAARLGLPERNSVTAHDAVVDYLRDRKLLLILDTCEHLLDACAGLAESLLLETDDVTVLATSRQPLDVSGENACPLDPLPVPAEGESPSPGDATDLFTRLATAADPGFAVTEDSQRDVIGLCRRLDGMPLAIELAAARLRTMPLAELATAPLAGPLPGKAPADPRHETLDQAIAWSYDLCDRAEQALWQRFSVFGDAIGIDAAEEVCAGAGLPRDAVVETLIGLVDKSVLRREPADGPARFRMLDTIQEFGARKLAASGTGDFVRRRLVDRYLNQARHFTDHLLDERQFPLYEEIRREQASLYVALAYCLDCASPGGRPPGPPDARPIASDRIGRARDDPFGREDLDDLDVKGAELATAVSWYWVAAGVPREGVRWLDRVLGIFAGPGPERVRALAARCFLASLAGEGERAVADGRECVALAGELGDASTGARGHLFLALALAVTQEYQAGLAAGAEAERRLTALDDRTGLRILAVTMMGLHALSEDFASAEEWYRRGVRMSGPTRERVLSGWLHLVGGYTLARQGRLEESAVAWQLALRAKHEAGDIVGTALALESFSLLAALAGRNARAAWLFGAAGPLWERAGAVLLNAKPLLDLHDHTYEQVREALGARRFDSLVRRGARSPLPRVVELAVADADELPAAPARAGLLTSREEEVAELAGTGLQNREIAKRMSVSKRTVDAHVGHIYAKLGVSSRAELAVWLSDRDSAESDSAGGSRDVPGCPLLTSTPHSYAIARVR